MTIVPMVELVVVGPIVTVVVVVIMMVVVVGGTAVDRPPPLESDEEGQLDEFGSVCMCVCVNR